MSNTTSHAKRELELAGLLNPEQDFYGGNTGKAVLELIEVFSKQGHSGMSASLVSEIFNKLCKFETLSPITGEDHEWNEVGDGLYQNNRNSAVFKENGKAYYIDGMIKRTPKGVCYSGSFYKDKKSFEKRDKNNLLYSTRSYIKEFPFTPKNFYIDVEEIEVAPDDWEMYARDSKQLKEVEKYYNLN